MNKLITFLKTKIQLIDGAGGTVKNLVFRAVKSEKNSVKTPEEFTNAVNLLIPSISSVYLLILTSNVNGTTRSS